MSTGSSKQGPSSLHLGGTRLVVQYQFDERIGFAIEKSIKSAQRFYNERRKAALERGEKQEPPSFESFANMAKGLMEANMRVEMGRLRNPSLGELLERTWAQKLLNYSTQKLLTDAYEALLRKF